MLTMQNNNISNFECSFDFIEIFVFETQALLKRKIVSHYQTRDRIVVNKGVSFGFRSQERESGNPKSTVGSCC
jgi:hypothetical protein